MVAKKSSVKKVSNNTVIAGGQAGDLIAVSSALAGELAGASTWWQLSGVVDAKVIRAAGVAAGIDVGDMPADTTPKTAIRRACVDQTSKRLMARSLSSGAWAMVREVERPGAMGKASDLDHQVVLTCRVDNAGRTLLFSGLEEYAALRYSIEQAYKTHLDQIDATDLSGWLVYTADRIRAVALRDRGGVYFIPRAALDTWRKVAGVLRTCVAGCDVYELPTLRSDEAVRSIVAAVTREAESMSAELRAKMQDGELGARALHARQKDCDTLCQKLEEYENLLGTSLASVKAQVTQTGADAMACALMISAGDESSNTSIAA